MRHLFGVAALAALLICVGRVSAQSSTFDFEDGTDQGFGAPFGADGDINFAIVNLPNAPADGTHYMFVPRTGGFQEAGNAHGNDGSNFFNAMAAAAANPAGYDLSYDWYVDTGAMGANAGTFFQAGSFVNTGNGYYAQDFGAVKEVELNGTQLASGGVFAGHVDVNFAAVGYNMPAGQTFFRLGLILNGNGSAQAMYFDNIKIAPVVPEPASLALLGLAVPALLRRRVA